MMALSENNPKTKQPFNFKTHTETVHPSKPAREKLKVAVFDLFKLASKRKGNKVASFHQQEARIDTMERNQNNEPVDLKNSIEIEVTQDVSDDDDVGPTVNVQIGKIITDNHREIMNELSGIKETLKDVINDENYIKRMEKYCKKVT